MIASAAPTIAHLHWQFLNRSETFIYHYLTAPRRYRPICLAAAYCNLEFFPLPEADRYYLTPPPRSLPWLADGLARRLLRRHPHVQRTLRARGAGLIHAHFGQNGPLALELARPLRLPVVTTFYGAEESKPAVIQRMARAYHRLFAEGALVLVEGPHMRQKVIGLGCPPAKVAVQRIALPLERFAWRPRPPKPRGQTVAISFCGRFVEKKGIPCLLEAVRQAHERHPGIELRLAGDGPLRPEIEAQIAKSGMAGYVKQLGFLTYQQHLDELAAADLFAHPSMISPDGDSEGGAPTTILEAQAMGLPVLSTTHADIPNVTAPGRSALLSAEGDPAALAANLCRLLEAPERWAEMGRAGRAFVEQHHEIRTEAAALDRIYQRLMDGQVESAPPPTPARRGR